MSIQSLIQIHQTYKGAVACWETFTQNLEAFFKESKSLPDLLIGEDKLSVSVKITDIKIVCKFEFEKDHFYLVYGFTTKDKYDKEMFVESSQQHVDDHGDTASEQRGGWSLRDKEDCWRIFFPRVLQAQKDAWKYAREAREAVTP